MSRRADKEQRERGAAGGGNASSVAAATAPAATEMPSHVYRWDLDKTYLKSEFESLRDLFRSAIEGAEKKQSVPGAAALLRELRRSGGARVCFISGSPRQMRRVLTRKLQ